MSTSRPAKILWACHSEAGPLRKTNQDACGLPPPWAERHRWGSLLAVADGVGGRSGGEDASRNAVACLQALYYADAGPEHPADRLRECFEGVNALNRLAKRRTGQKYHPLTTLVAAVIQGDRIWIANIGDSRAYLILAKDCGRRQLTEDHSSQIRLIKAGLASSATADRSGILTRAIGMEENCQVDIYHYTWMAGDGLVLCSDGLAAIGSDEMAQTVLERTPDRAAVDLVRMAVQMDGSDNCTALVARWEAGETHA